jgi:hypothetical protein
MLLGPLFNPKTAHPNTLAFSVHSFWLLPEDAQHSRGSNGSILPGPFQQQAQGFQPQIFPSRNNKNMFKDSTHHYFGHGCSKSSTFRNLVGWVLCFFLVFDDWLVVLTYPNKISVMSTNYPKHGWSTINMVSNVSTPQIIIGCIPVISNLWNIYIYIKYIYIYYIPNFSWLLRCYSVKMASAGDLNPAAYGTTPSPQPWRFTAGQSRRRWSPSSLRGQQRKLVEWSVII